MILMVRWWNAYWEVRRPVRQDGLMLGPLVALFIELRRWAIDLTKRSARASFPGRRRTAAGLDAGLFPITAIRRTFKVTTQERQNDDP